MEIITTHLQLHNEHDICSHHCEKTQIEMVWAHNKINRTCKDDSTGQGARREKERQTEKKRDGKTTYQNGLD